MSVLGRALARMRGRSLEPTDRQIRKALEAVSFADYPRIFLDDIANVERVGRHMSVFRVTTTKPPQFIMVLHADAAPTMAELRDAFVNPGSTLLNFEPASK